MDILLIQYGTLQDHTTEEARSRFLAPVSILPLTARTAEKFKNLSDLQSPGGSVWQFYPEHARITHEWRHHIKRQDGVSF
jgi:hypothetical protein